jgi:hypothetical protein
VVHGGGGCEHAISELMLAAVMIESEGTDSQGEQWFGPSVPTQGLVGEVAVSWIERTDSSYIPACSRGYAEGCTLRMCRLYRPL